MDNCESLGNEWDGRKQKENNSVQNINSKQNKQRSYDYRKIPKDTDSPKIRLSTQTKTGSQQDHIFRITSAQF